MATQFHNASYIQWWSIWLVSTIALQAFIDTASAGELIYSTDLAKNYAAGPQGPSDGTVSCVLTVLIIPNAWYDWNKVQQTYYLKGIYCDQVVLLH